MGGNRRKSTLDSDWPARHRANGSHAIFNIDPYITDQMRKKKNYFLYDVNWKIGLRTGYFSHLKLKTEKHATPHFDFLNELIRPIL